MNSAQRRIKQRTYDRLRKAAIRKHNLSNLIANMKAYNPESLQVKLYPTSWERFVTWCKNLLK